MELKNILGLLILINTHIISENANANNIINKQNINNRHFDKLLFNDRVIRSVLTNKTDIITPNNSINTLEKQYIETNNIIKGIIGQAVENQNIVSILQQNNNQNNLLTNTSVLQYNGNKTVTINGTNTNILSNGTSLNPSNNGTQENKKNKSKLFQSIITGISNLPQAAKSFDKSFSNLQFQNQTVIMKNMDFIARESRKSLLNSYLNPDLAKNFNISILNNDTVRETIKNTLDTMVNATNIDFNFNPKMRMLRTNVPWKHVSEATRNNETEIIQICRFEDKIAKCTSDYPQWHAKLWFDFGEADNRNGINIITYERGYKPRVSFFNRVNATECQKFNNGTFHQICVKIYGYEKDAGPTRVCLSLGVAIFNHGVASTDFGCFRFGSSVRHENPLEGEAPETRLLNDYILKNDYNNIINITDNQPNSASLSEISLLLFIYLISLIIIT